ncbi:DinB superfamily protein [Streptomyces sp. YIM 130001]|uniref:DinB family protein n=1 Tax=Streptomyces sp. YIM 130001 TaxID=2259644 RepID=UPI000E652B68|nr:DinB family protein [Streptomyces sp. YIM 130001]RII12439.1 DinB superfamily protein [Streptomyces sp. YIM 130001]
MVAHVSAEAHGDERGALLGFLEEARGGIRRSLLGLSEEQAASTPSASELSLSGLLKHVVEVEQGWTARAKGEDAAVARDETNWHECFRLVGDETIAGQLAYWERVSKDLEDFIRSAPSLDDTFALPDQPWFPKEDVSLRWLLLRLISEMDRHAGHADIIRESLDGRTAFELVAEADTLAG